MSTAIRICIARWRLNRRMRRLTYTYHRCECGALYAADFAGRAWDCSDILLGLAPEIGQHGSVRHGDRMPFIFWKVKEAPLAWALEHRVKRGSP